MRLHSAVCRGMCVSQSGVWCMYMFSMVTACAKKTVSLFLLVLVAPARGQKDQTGAGRMDAVLPGILSFAPISTIKWAFFTAQNGKLYDAYVSFLNADSTSAETANFALHILPEKLEKQHGYSLYIRGRDDCPGEGLRNSFTCLFSW